MPIAQTATQTNSSATEYGSKELLEARARHMEASHISTPYQVNHQPYIVDQALPTFEQALNSNKSLTSSLGEPKNITERRKALSDVLSTLKNSLKVLQRDPE